jgi:hypothetical protein
VADAAWTVAVRRRSVDEDGTAVLHADLLDGDELAGALLVTVTAGRDLRVLWTQQPGTPPLTGFQAWESVAPEPETEA